MDAFEWVPTLKRSQVVVLDTCGVLSLAEGNRRSVVTAMASGTALFAWAADAQINGGQYRLCWCAGRPGTRFDGIVVRGRDGQERPQSRVSSP